MDCSLQHKQQHHNSTCSNNPVLLALIYPYWLTGCKTPIYLLTLYSQGLPSQLYWSIRKDYLHNSTCQDNPLCLQGLSSQLCWSICKDYLHNSACQDNPLCLQGLSSQLYWSIFKDSSQLCFSGQSSLFARANCSVVLHLNQSGQLIILFRAVRFC